MELTSMMRGWKATVLVIAMLWVMVVAIAYGETFNDEFSAYTTDYHVNVAPDGQQVQLVLDQVAAAGFSSKNQYLFGNISMNIKLVPGNSAGTVTAYYFSSAQPNHDEIDFEFLGNTSGQPYVLQTNVFANGIGGREQRIYLWFDPTTDFHTYGILWNTKQILFLVDGKPIRVYKNLENLGVAYCNSKPVNLYSSLWDGDSWATEGGLIKLNWTDAPFVTTFNDFSNLDGCVVTNNDVSACTASTTSNWWEQSAYQTLAPSQNEQLLWVAQNYMIYNYCTDTSRYPTPPVECSQNSPS